MCGSAVMSTELNLTGFVRQSIGVMPRSDRRRYWSLALARLVVSGVDLAAVALLGVGVDRLSESGIGSASGLLLAAVAALILRSALTLLLNRITFGFLARVEESVGSRFTESVFSAHQEALEAFRTQELAFALAQGTNSLTTRALGFTMIAISDGLAALGLVAVFTVLFPLEGIVLVTVAIALISPAQWFVNRRVRKAAAAWSNATISVLHQVQEFQGSRREIFLNAASRQASDRLTVDRRRAARRAAEFNFLLTVPRTVVEVGTLVAAALLLAVAYARRPEEEFLTFSAVLIAVTFRVAPLMMAVVGAIGVVTQSQGETTINRAVLGATRGATLQSSDPLSTQHNPSMAIEVDGVGYTYPGSTGPVLSRVSFNVGMNEVCAIVGPSGSGKTTLLECVLGLRDPSDGRVQIFGQSPEELRLRHPGTIGLVSQTPVLRTAPLAENVAMFETGAIDRQRVSRMLNQVGLQELVERLPQGIDTEVGEGRILLSGGEKQRVGLARALYRDPALLVLDEPTSALDGLNEEAVFALLEAERLHRTIVLITHRQPRGFPFDRVLNVADGTVTEAVTQRGASPPT